jgi:hypothetical protein
MARTSIRGGVVVDGNTANISTLVTDVSAIKTKTDNLPADTATTLAAIPTSNKYYWKDIDWLTGNRNPPVQNEWYTILDTAETVKGLAMSLNQNNAETANKFFDLEVTRDGKSAVVTNFMELSAPTQKGVTIGNDDVTEIQAALDKYLGGDLYSVGSLPLEANGLKIRIRLTSAAGTNQYLAWSLRYQVKTLVT